MAEEEEEIIMEEIRITLPQDIIIEILSWLPAKSLLSSFKFVCKIWRNVIREPDFIKMHLNRGAINGGGGGRGISNNDNNNSSLICKSGKRLFQLHPPFNFEGVPPIAATKLDFDSLSLSSRLVGSCNGLLCISVSPHERIMLLNPSTKRYKLSPKEPVECPPNLDKYRSITYGFGCCYDSTNNIDEYKVIRIAFFSGVDNGKLSSRYQLDIYYMSSNAWRRETNIIDYPYKISSQQSGVSVNGALHWMGRTLVRTRTTVINSWDTISAFDIRDEVFRQVPVPVSCQPTADDPYFHMRDIILLNMRGCLSMIRFSYGNNKMDVVLEIWVMKEYGIKESWTEEFVIRSSDSDPPRALSKFAISSNSTAHVLKGDQILIEGLTYKSEGSQSPSVMGYRKLVLYDMKEKKIDGDFKMIGVPDKLYVDQFDYIETLVSLKSLLLPSSKNRKRKKGVENDRLTLKRRGK